MPRRLTRTLLSEFPELAAELDEVKTGLRAEEVAPFTGRSVWWLCPRGHSWSRSVQCRTQAGQTCPFCNGNKPIPGETSFAALNPKGLMAEWDFDRNTVDPDQILPGYTKKVFWKCDAADDHRWETSPKMRVKGTDGKGTGCPFCARSRPSSTCNLALLHPDLMRFWDHAKNEEPPTSVMPTASKKYWWLCENGHSYDMAPANKTTQEQGCPFCAGQRRCADNGFAAARPDLLPEWAYDLNPGIDPVFIAPNSPVTEYHWRCLKDPSHTWPATTQHRQRGFGCPKCSGTVLTYELSLAAQSPRDAALLDVERSGVEAEALHAKSNMTVWWRCPVSPEHAWEATPEQQGHRVRSGCKFCEKQAVWSGYNLAVVYPTVAAEWHPTKNGDLRPTDVLPASNKTVWWQCAAVPTHEWKAKVTNRTSGGNGCRDCSKGSRVSIRELALRNMVALVFPNAHEGVIDGLGRFKNVDILIPEHDLVIEYDGANYHRNREDRDTKKTQALFEAGYATFRIREEPLPPIEGDDLVLSYRVPLVKLGAQVIEHTLDLLGLILPVPDEVELAAAADAAQREYTELCKLGQQRKAPHNRDGHKAA